MPIIVYLYKMHCMQWVLVQENNVVDHKSVVYTFAVQSIDCLLLYFSIDIGSIHSDNKNQFLFLYF